MAASTNFFSVTVQRSLKDKDGVSQHSQSLRRRISCPQARLLEQDYDKLLVAPSTDDEP